MPIDSMRCSRLGLTLFSYPEYVWITNQRFSGARTVSIIDIPLCGRRDEPDRLGEDEVPGGNEQPDRRAHGEDEHGEVSNLVAFLSSVMVSRAAWSASSRFGSE